MGCGFSTEDNQKASTDEEQSIIDRESSTRTKAYSTKEGSGKTALRNHRKTTPATSNNATAATVSTSSAVPINQNNEISSSQVNFFKMLDEKIEQGFELEENELEDERHLRLQKVAEEWPFGLLGRSQDSSDLRLLAHQQQNIGNQAKSESVSAEDDEDDRLEVQQTTARDKEASSSVDSMRTMFSNSVNLPAGTLREVVTNKQEWYDYDDGKTKWYCSIPRPPTKLPFLFQRKIPTKSYLVQFLYQGTLYIRVDEDVCSTQIYIASCCAVILDT